MTEATPRRGLPDWVQKHVDEYLATDGEKGHEFQGVPALLLTTTGRRSGQPLQLPLIYGEDGGRYLVVASRGGSADHPDWYKNLVAEPDVQVQVKADRFSARARTASDAEKPALWELMAKIWPAYNEYQTKTERPIPVVILERA